MCDNRWKFRRIIKKVFRILEKLKLEIAYEKTMVGRTSTKCFDFLGFNIGGNGLSVSKNSVRKFAENVVLRLFSHLASAAEENTCDGKARISVGSGAYGACASGANSKKGDLSIPDSILKYVQQWLIWVKSIYAERKTVLEPPEAARAAPRRRAGRLRQ